MKKYLLFIIIGIFLLAFIPRLYKIDNPIADWHSWRQADTASVTRNFVKEGFTPFFPKFDSLNSLNETQTPNPNRYFFAEFPLYNIITYPFYVLFGINEIYARLVSVFFSSLTAVILFFLVRNYSGNKIALISSVVFALLPYNIYYGRVILADPLYVFFGVLTLYLVTKFVQRNNLVISFLAGISFSLAILTKPYALVLSLPIAYILYKKWGLKFIKQYKIYIFSLISLIPFLIWRWHIQQHPEGMFGTTWLFNQGNIRFTGAYFRWLIFERMNKLIFATGGFALFWIGIVTWYTKKEGLFYYIWLLSILVFFVIIARGNVTHDYYQLPLVPIGSIFIAKGIDFIINSSDNLNRKIFNYGVVFVLSLLTLAFGWYEVRGFFNINHPEIVEAGKAVDKLLPKEAIVIAPYDLDPAFLYQTNRYGYTIGADRIPEFINNGATHLVSVNFDENTNVWMDKCKIIEKTDSYVIIDLKEC